MIFLDYFTPKGKSVNSYLFYLIFKQPSIEGWVQSHSIFGFILSCCNWVQLLLLTIIRLNSREKKVNNICFTGKSFKLNSVCTLYRKSFFPVKTIKPFSKNRSVPSSFDPHSFLQ